MRAGSACVMLAENSGDGGGGQQLGVLEYGVLCNSRAEIRGVSVFRDGHMYSDGAAGIRIMIFAFAVPSAINPRRLEFEMSLVNPQLSLPRCQRSPRRTTASHLVVCSSIPASGIRSSPGDSCCVRPLLSASSSRRSALPTARLRITPKMPC